MKNFLKRNILLILVLLYFIWPIDFIPDVLIPLGVADDFGLLFLAILERLYRASKEGGTAGESAE